MTGTESVPVITTARLTLRAHHAADFPACAAIWADERVTRFIGARPFTRAETWSRILRYRGLWALLGFGYWAIEERATRAFVGELGFAEFQREIEPPLGGIPELGWVIDPAAQRRGFATEALRAVLDWGDAHLGAAETACIISPGNAASLRVAEHAGYEHWTATTYLGSPVLMFRRPRSARPREAPQDPDRSATQIVRPEP